MSNQLVDGFQGSQPFITDKEFQNMSLDEIKYIIKLEREELKKDYNEFTSRRTLINQYKKLVEARQKVKQGIDIKKEHKKKAKAKKLKTFEDYYEKCIKNKKIPKDTPVYLREALMRTMKEYDQGIKIEKSALNKFGVKYIIDGVPGLSPFQFLGNYKASLESFF